MTKHELTHDSPIKSVAELKGRKVALNEGSNVHYLLVRQLEQHGLTLADIQPIYLAPADGRAAFESRNVDAWVIWDPFQAAAEKATGARVLADGTPGIVHNDQSFRALKQTHGHRLQPDRCHPTVEVPRGGAAGSAPAQPGGAPFGEVVANLDAPARLASQS